jgi:hypothetical protein
VFDQTAWTGPSHVLRASLLLVDLLLVSLLVIVAWSIARIARRRGVLNRPK